MLKGCAVNRLPQHKPVQSRKLRKLVFHNYLFDALNLFRKQLPRPLSTSLSRAQVIYCPYVKVRTVSIRALQYETKREQWHGSFSLSPSTDASSILGTGCLLLCASFLAVQHQLQDQVFLICKPWWSLQLLGAPLSCFTPNCLVIVFRDWSPLDPSQPFVAGCPRLSFPFVIIVVLLSTWGDCGCHKGGGLVSLSGQQLKN